MWVKVCSPDRDTEFFDIVAGVLQGDTLVPYTSIICLDYVFKTSRDLMKTIMDTNYTDGSTSCKYTYLSWIPAA